MFVGVVAAESASRAATSGRSRCRTGMAPRLEVCACSDRPANLKMAQVSQEDEEVGGMEGFAFGGGAPIVGGPEDSLYAVLNVSKGASVENVRSAYRQLCIQYHPDKHATLDESSRQAAQAMFQRIKFAYEVLSDPQKRVIYDVYGEQGLEADLDVMPRFQTPAELLEMHERLQRMKEDEHLERMTRPHGQARLKLDAKQLFTLYGRPSADEQEEENEDEDDVDEPVEGTTYGEERGVLQRLEVAQSIEVPLTANDTLGYACSMQSTVDGRGEGSVTTSLRHSFSSSCWVQGESQLGDVTAFSVKGFRQLPAACFVFSHLTMHLLHGNVIVPAPRVLVGRQLDLRTVGELEWSPDSDGTGEEGMTTRIVHSADRGPVSASFTLGPYNTFARLQAKPRVTGKLRGLIEAKLGTHGFQLAYGLDHAVTKFTRVGLRVQTAFPGGVTLTLRWVTGL